MEVPQNFRGGLPMKDTAKARISSTTLPVPTAGVKSMMTTMNGFSFFGRKRRIRPRESTERGMVS